jgi:hypothetical protein
MKSSFHSLVLFFTTALLILFSVIQLPSQETHLLSLLALGRTQQKTPFPSLEPNSTLIVAYVFVAVGTCLPSRCLAMNVYSGSTILAFRRRITLLPP